MRHRMLHNKLNKLKQHSVSHSSIPAAEDEESSSSVSESCANIDRASTPIPESEDDEYWMDDNDNDVNGCSTTVPTVSTANNDKNAKFCYFCKKSYIKFPNRKARLKHINRCKKNNAKLSLQHPIG